MSSTYIGAGGRSADLSADPGGSGEEDEAIPRSAVVARRKRPGGRPHLPQALTLALALLALGAGGALVALPILASGSARPSDWGRVNWSLVSARYQVCAHGKQGLGAVRCLTAIGPHPGLSTAPQKRGVVYVTTPVQAPPSTAAPPAGSSAAPGAAAPGQGPAGPAVPTAAAPAAPAPAAAAPATGGGDDGGGGGGDDGGGGGGDG